MGLLRITCVLAVCAITIPAAASTLLVPDSFPSIADALAVAAPGDSVVLANGTYYERDLDLVSGITLASESGDPSTVTIDGEYLGRIMQCESLTEPSVVRGITFTHGVSGHEDGGAVYCHTADVTFSDVVFRANGTYAYGGAVYCLGGAFVFERVTFMSNGAYFEGQGGALFSRQCTPCIVDCHFEDNEAEFGGAIGGLIASNPEVENSTFIGNTALMDGGAVYVGSAGGGYSGVSFVGNTAGREGGAVRASNGCSFEDSVFIGNSAVDGGGFACLTCNPQFVNVTFYGNSATGKGGGIYAWYSDPWLAKVIVAFSSDGEGLCCEYNSEPVIICCDVFGNADGDYAGGIPDYTGIAGNISEDPEFCDAPSGDLGLHESSPCAAANSECGELVGAHDVACSAPTAIEEMSWGKLKALYR